MNDERDIQLAISALQKLSEIERPETDSDTNYIDSDEVLAELSDDEIYQINQAKELLQKTLGSDENSLEKEVEKRLNSDGYYVSAFKYDLVVTTGDWKLTL